jgi:hypothetical protein
MMVLGLKSRFKYSKKKLQSRSINTLALAFGGYASPGYQAVVET